MSQHAFNKSVKKTLDDFTTDTDKGLTNKLVEKRQQELGFNGMHKLREEGPLSINRPLLGTKLLISILTVCENIIIYVDTTAVIQR